MSNVIQGVFGKSRYLDVIAEPTKLPHQDGEVLCSNGDAFRYLPNPMPGWNVVDAVSRLPINTPEPPCAA